MHSNKRIIYSSNFFPICSYEIFYLSWFENWFFFIITITHFFIKEYSCYNTLITLVSFFHWESIADFPCNQSFTSLHSSLYVTLESLEEILKIHYVTLKVHLFKWNWIVNNTHLEIDELGFTHAGIRKTTYNERTIRHCNPSKPNFLYHWSF